MGTPALDTRRRTCRYGLWTGSNPDQKEAGNMTVKTKDIDRTIRAVAKLGLFANGELKLSPAEFDRLWDDVTWLLEQVNDEKWRLENQPPAA